MALAVPANIEPKSSGSTTRSTPFFRSVAMISKDLSFQLTFTFPDNPLQPPDLG